MQRPLGVNVQRVLVYGGRDFDDRAQLYQRLDRLQPLEIGHGAARGADSLAGTWALLRNVPCRAYPAKWEQYGKRAGPIRNQHMLDDFQPTLAVECPGGAGTRDMRGRLQRAGVRILYLHEPL